MLVVFQILADWIARAGLRRRSTTAERLLPDAEHAWTLVALPASWPLWMPGVQTLLDGDRAPRRGARYHVALRLRSGRLGFGSAREGYVQIDEWTPELRIAWRLLAGRHEERYDLHREGSRFVCRAEAGEAAERVLGELAREAAPLA